MWNLKEAERRDLYLHIVECLDSQKVSGAFQVFYAFLQTLQKVYAKELSKYGAQACRCVFIAA